MAQARPARPPVMRPRQKQQKGFAIMTAAKRHEIATLGGLAVSKDRLHMAELGRIGGVHRTLSPAQRAERSRLAALQLRRD